MESGLIWSALSSLAAVAAFAFSILVWLNQRKSDRAQRDVQGRLARIEEERRQDEISVREAAARVASSARVSVRGLRLVQGGRAGEFDKVSITLLNAGLSPARRVTAALLESEDRAKEAGLGELVEEEHAVGGYSGASPLGYYKIRWSGADPLDVLQPGRSVVLTFWHRFRLIGAVQLRIEWEDDRGTHVERQIEVFQLDPQGPAS